jgi:hypothetical protein
MTLPNNLPHHYHKMNWLGYNPSTSLLVKR